jgi:hypothetical protein
MKQKTRDKTRARRLFRKLANLLRSKNKTANPKLETLKSWHRIIEGGILVRITNQDGALGVVVLGERAVYIVTEKMAEAQQAKEHMEKRFGSAEMITEDIDCGKTLCFIYRPLSFWDVYELTDKYDEMINVNYASNKDGRGWGPEKVSKLDITSLDGVKNQSENSKPFDD